MKEQTYEDLYLIMERLASKRRTGSDNLISKTNRKLSNHKNSKMPSNLQSPQNQYYTPDKYQQHHSNFPFQNKIQSMNLNTAMQQQKCNNSTQPKNPKNKGVKTIDNPELLGFHKVNLSKLSNSENFQKKIVFTEPDMNCSEDPNFLKTKYSKFSVNQKNKRLHADMTHVFEKNRSMTNFLKPNYSTGLTSNSRPTKQTEEDFDSGEISEGKNCDNTTQEIKDIKENYLAEGGFDYELIEKMNELSDGVKYTFGGVGISHEGEQQNTNKEEDEEKKDGDQGRYNQNLSSMRELKNVR